MNDAPKIDPPATTPIFSSSAPPSPSPRSPSVARGVFVAMAMGVVALVVGAASAAFIAQQTMSFMRHELETQRAWMQVQLHESRDWASAKSDESIREMHKIADEVMVPPTNDKLFTILSKGYGVTEDVLKTDAGVGTTPEGAFTTDLTTAQQTDAYTQEFLIQNTHATQNLCVKGIAWASAGANCTAKCAAQTITCSGATTDGWRLLAGQAREYRMDGTNCVCVVGSAASTTYQSERVIR